MSARKPTAKRQGNAGTTADLSLVADESLAPEADTSWAEPVAEQWAELWAAPLAKYLSATDVPALRRLFGMYDERASCMAALDDPDGGGRLAVGSTGQLVAHPYVAMVANLDTRIKDLEDRYGLTPKARLGLGIDLGKAAKSLDDINRKFGNHGNQGASEEQDPRLKAIES